MSERWTESKVFDRLKGPFPSPAWVLLPQVRNGTGFKRKTTRTADALGVSVYPSRGIYMVGFEIKVSKSDWRKELADPGKAADMQKWCRHWYIAAPKDVVPHGELPETWGLIECTAKTAKIVVKAPKLEPESPDMLLVASILRKASEINAQMVHKRDVDAIVTERVDDQMTKEREHFERVEKGFVDRIKAFQDASGVSISDWNAGRIGEAVRTVLNGHHLHAATSLKALKRTAQQIIEMADRTLESIES